MLTTINIVKFPHTAKKTVALFLKRNITRIYFPVHCLPKQMFAYSHLNADKLHRQIYTFNNIKFSLCLNLYSTLTSKDIHSLVDTILDEHSDSKDLFEREELIKILDFLASYGCSAKEIKENCLKYLTPTKGSYLKVVQIAKLDSDVVSLMPFLALPLTSLRRAAKQAREDKIEIIGFPTRILYLSHHFETATNKLASFLIKHPSLLTMKLERLHHKMIILKNAGISSKDLVNDLWIFNYNEEKLMKRITATEKAGVKVKPWMLRCSGNVFTSMLNRYSQTQHILGSDDIISYLSKRLDCSQEYVEHMMERNKSLKSINIPKIDQILKFLFEKGYTPQEIRLFPRVFCTKLETLNKKMEEHKLLHSTLPSIPQLCVTKKISRKT